MTENAPTSVSRPDDGIPSTEEEKAIRELVDAFDDLPILARLEFISNVVCSKSRNNDTDEIADKSLAVADGVLDGVIRVLRTVRQLNELRGPLG